MKNVKITKSDQSYTEYKIKIKANMDTWKRQRWDQKLRRNKQPLLTDHFCGEPSILSGCKRDTTCRSHNYYIKNSLTTGTFRVCPQHSGFFAFSNAGHLLWIKRSAGILVLPIDIACIGKKLLFCGTKGGDSDEENKAMFRCVYLCTYTDIKSSPLEKRSNRGNDV